MRRKTAKEILTASFQELAAVKSIDKITIQEIVDQTDADDYQWKQTLYDGARLYNENKDYLVNLLQHTSGHDSFMRYMTQINCAALEKYILSVRRWQDKGICIN